MGSIDFFSRLLFICKNIKLLLNYKYMIILGKIVVVFI